MRRQRHPHSHIDPRQPRDNSLPATNPPVFAWKPPSNNPDATHDTDARYSLTIARDESLSDVVLRVEDLRDPVYLPERVFEPGRYWWRWSMTPPDGMDEPAAVFTFEISSDSVALEVPRADEWLRRMPDDHPRIFIDSTQLTDLRASRKTERVDAWKTLRDLAEQRLGESHEIAEPPFLPDRQKDYTAFFRVWQPIMNESRRFVSGALDLALAYLASGDRRYARAACQRMASISAWDPHGSSHIDHNDEAHMSVIWNGAIVCDWVWDEFTDDEREAVVEQFRERGRITYEHMHDRGMYGVTRFDSHAGREIVFLALIAFVFHEHIPEAAQWLDWLRPVLCGIWPVWAGDDGAWAEGPSYAHAYVRIMTLFATTLKHGVGVDLYRRPFWTGHAEWRRRILPPYAEWIGFGDHTERRPASWRSTADLVEIIARNTGTWESFREYSEALRAEADTMSTPAEPTVDAQLYLAPVDSETNDYAAYSLPHETLRVFPGAGWAALRTDLPEVDAGLHRVAFVFRSSPLGSISHSHANSNDFFLHVNGRIMVMPSGYYDGYGTAHHQHWVWHTKANNCVTLSGAPELMRSHDAVGAIIAAFEDSTLAYLQGNADACYADRAERMRRHVVYLKRHGVFVFVDEFQPKTGIASAVEWNLHSWNQFSVDEDTRRFSLNREERALNGYVMWHRNGFFSLSEGWDPPPTVVKPNDQWHMQYHLRYTVAGHGARVLGVVLATGHPDAPLADVTTDLVDGVETARIGGDIVVKVAAHPSDVPIVSIETPSGVYHINGAGIKCT